MLPALFAAGGCHASVPLQSGNLTTQPGISQNEAGKLVGRFCGLLVHANARNDLAAIARLATPDLTAAIRQALLRSGAIQKQFPDEKPPLGDGVPWTSYQDFAPGCAIGKIATRGGNPEVGVVYSFPDQPGAGWTDLLVLQRDTSGWRIADIRYGNGDYRYTLRATLSDAFK